VRDFPTNRLTLFAALLRAANMLNRNVEQKDQGSGVIVLRCLTLALDWILSRCWSDKPLFELTDVGENKTRLVVYAIPNLLRIRVARSQNR